MKLSLDWIRDFTTINTDGLTPLQLGDKISLGIAEVEEVEVIGGALRQVVVAKVIACEKHPEADKLQLATIDNGTEQIKLVCGAKNCRPGMTTAFAGLGSKLPSKDKEGKPCIFEIKKANIRGFESIGMLCSLDELGLAEGSEGILELSNELTPGTALAELEQFAGCEDILFEIDNKSLTHRPDLWGHYGFARDLAALFDSELKPFPQAEVPAGDSHFQLAIASEACLRYSGLHIVDIKVEESPDWLKNRLKKAGINSISNIVDITNYLLLELGQPMHAFDSARISGQKIKVRAAHEGENFNALDGESYTLNEEDMVIDLGGKAEALAGVMGGADSSVNENTTKILLESACFNAGAVRRSATRHGLRTDSSARFEKSLDPENTILALKRAWQLIKQVCPDAKLVGGIVDEFPRPYAPITLSTSCEFIRQRLGADISDEFIRTKLSRLGFGLSEDLQVEIPSWRRTKDVSISEDLVEEVGRLFGYDNIVPTTLRFDCLVPTANPARQKERAVKTLLAESWNCTEILTYPWIGDKQLQKFGLSSEGLMTLKNAVGEDSRFMKPNDMPLLIPTLAENQKYASDFRLFNFTRIYDTTAMKGLLPTERQQFTGAFVAPAKGKNDLGQELFYEMKSMVQDALRVLGIQGAQLKPFQDDAKADWVHPNINATFCRGRQVLAEIFRLHPAITSAQGIKGNAYIFVIHFDECNQSLRKYKYEQTSKFPAVPFDITVQCAQRELAGNVQQVIAKGAAKALRSLEVVSIFDGEGVPEGKKNVSFRMTFANPKKTLSPEEILDLQKAVVKAISKKGFEIPNLPDMLKA